jgi:putative ABC transport system permease protein
MRYKSIKTFIKYLLKNKLYSIVTLSGFAISLMFVVLLSIYTKQELSVDQFHTNSDRIYRMCRDNGATFSPMTAEIVKNQLPEVESYTRIYQNGGNVTFEGKESTRIDYLLADSSFFNIFSFRLIEGDPHQVLAAKNAAVLCSQFANKVFGTENPLGKPFSINGISFIVSGIAEDFPENTHFRKCDAILNFPVLADLWQWPGLLTTNDNSSFGLYLLAKKETNLVTKAPLLLEQFKKDYWLFSQGFSKSLWFEPLSEVYFSKEVGPAIKQNSRSTVYIFGAITLLILIIAIINYINLTVAQVGFRSKETAIKKLMGSSKQSILWQNIFESIFLSSIAALFGLGLAFAAEPFFNAQMDCNLNLKNQFSFSLIGTMLGIIAVTGFISGIIPAIVTNQFNPIEVVKGKLGRKTKASYSKVLISFQYGVAIILLVTTSIIARQSKFMQEYDLGFNKENLFWMDNTIEPSQKAAFRDILKSIPGVAEVSYSRGTPLDGGNNHSFDYFGKPVSFQEFYVDSSFFKMLGIQITPTNIAYSKDGIWLNQATIDMLELGKDPVSFKYHDKEVPVMGIIGNFNFRPLHQQIGPLMIRPLPEEYTPWSISVKLMGTDLLTTVDRIKKAQSKFTGGIPMNSGFYNDTMNQWYSKEVKRSKLIGAFTLLAIIISSMGIFAMSLYYIQQKIKEIGIRKVNGARISEVLIMLNKDFVKWVAIAFGFATPIAYFAMQKWLENFAYKTELSWWIFALAGLLALGIALLTVSWQSWKAARRNPVESLRYE